MSGCGGGACTCGGGQAVAAQRAAINGITLHAEGEVLDEMDLRERAWTELLRQEAVRQGRLPRVPLLEAPALSDADRERLQAMLDEVVQAPAPDETACRRWYEANAARFVHGRRARVRHILFAVTPRVDVERLAARAEQVLLQLTRKDAPAGLFAQRARELSNCPSGAEGGELGWLHPAECVEEFARELFPNGAPARDLGIKQRLVHSRYGLHVVDVQERDEGRQLAYEEVRERIAAELAQQSRATALHQYMQLLAGRAVVEGVELEAAASPLVQ
jgi:peptidyl-prolyl cis-trans isomerase C